MDSSQSKSRHRRVEGVSELDQSAEPSTFYDDVETLIKRAMAVTRYSRNHPTEIIPKRLIAQLDEAVGQVEEWKEESPSQMGWVDDMGRP